MGEIKFAGGPCRSGCSASIRAAEVLFLFQLYRFGAMTRRFDIAFIIDMKSDEIFNPADFWVTKKLP